MTDIEDRIQQIAQVIRQLDDSQVPRNIRTSSKDAVEQWLLNEDKEMDLRLGMTASILDEIFNDADASAMRINRTPLRRWGEPEEIAAGILFLCSDDASFITGTELVIDGGVLAALQ